MKLFTKISLIVAAIAGGVGIVAVVVGLAMGANVKDLENVGIYIGPNGIRSEIGNRHQEFRYENRTWDDDDWDRFEEQWDEYEEQWDEYEEQWEDFEDWQERELRHHGKDL